MTSTTARSVEHHSPPLTPTGPSDVAATADRNPRVSIGLTVFNGEPFLAETLEAFLAQTFKDFEVIISDNASTDRTGEIARGFAARDGRVRYYRNETNLGLAGNHNIVVKLARGEYFKWAAADDLCRPDYLARCVEALDADPSVVLAYPRTQFIDEAGAKLDIVDPGWDMRSEQPADRLQRVITSGHWMNAIVGLMRTSALRETRLMPPYSGGDYRVLAELSLLGKVHEVPETLFLRRIHPNSTSQHGTSAANPDRKWLIQCWTGSDSAVSLPLWSLSIDYFRTIAGSPLQLRQKASLVGSLLRRTALAAREAARRTVGGDPRLSGDPVLASREGAAERINLTKSQVEDTRPPPPSPQSSGRPTSEKPTMACCRFCGATLRHTFVDLGMSPLCESYVSEEQLHQMEPFYPLHVYTCGVLPGPA